ncbi:MAG TPA: hypothetical protein VMU95_08235 [Trebonia sp.]|nr:hypothetical protein [Trebonia sp.]
MYFWPAVREHVTGGDALADEATGQEQEGKQVLDQLKKADAASPRFEQLLFTFTKAAQDHIRFDEETVWPRTLSPRRTRPATPRPAVGARTSMSTSATAIWVICIVAVVSLVAWLGSVALAARPPRQTARAAEGTLASSGRNARQLRRPQRFTPSDEPV